MVTWVENKIIIKMDKNYSFLSEGFIKLFEREREVENFRIKHTGKELEIYVDFKLNQNHYLMFNNMPYVFSGAVNLPVVDEETESVFEIKSTTALDEDDGIVIAKKNTQYRVEVYSNETYPDFPLFEKKGETNADDQVVHRINRGEIVKVITSDGDVEYVSKRPLYYFSNVKALKDDIAEYGFQTAEKTEEEYKKIIAEKSTYLKTRFGLLEHHTKDFELIPLFKMVVNLLCMKDLCAIYYISGGFNPDGVMGSPGDMLKLGKFTSENDSTGSSSGGSGSTLDIIDIMIKNAVKDLEHGLFNPSKNIAKVGGRNAQTKVSSCFSNR